MGSKRWRRNRRLKCWCLGYEFPHRRTSGACHNRLDRQAALLCKARRQKAPPEVLAQITADFNYDNPGVLWNPNDPIPF